MKAIRLSEEQRYNLCCELARIATQYEIFGNVECIYAMPYDSEYADGDQLNVVIVRKIDEYKYLEYHIDYYNDRMKKEKGKNYDKYGVDLLLSYDNADYYDSSKYYMSREGYLLNSIILYDRTGKYMRLKQEEEKNEALNLVKSFDNSTEFIPPLTDEQAQTGLVPDQNTPAALKLSFRRNKSIA